MNINLSEVLSTGVDVCGILGFAISLVVAIVSFRKYKFNLIALDARIIPAYDITPSAAFWLDFVVANASELPVSITHITACIDNQSFNNCDSVYRSTKTYPDGVSINFSVASPLPTPLSPFFAKRQVVAIPHHPASLKLIRQAEADNQPIWVQLILHTSRRDVHIRLQAQFVSSSAYLTYRAAAERASL